MSSLKKILPDPVIKGIRKIRSFRSKTKVAWQFFWFPLKKTFWIDFIRLFPDNINAHEKLIAAYYLNRKQFKNPIVEYREFLFHFNNLFRLKPESILQYRVTVYFAHLIQQDFMGMKKAMGRYLSIQKKLREEKKLDKLNISLCTENLFSNYNVHAYLDTHIKASLLGMRPATKITLFLKPGDLNANPVMFNYWKKYVDVITDPAEIKRLEPSLPYIQEDLSFTVPLNDGPVYIEHAKSIVQKEWERAGKKPLLELSDEDKEFGRAELEKAGIPRDAWFVSLHVRDAGYKMGSHLAEDSFDSYRNSDIENYITAIKSVVERGGYVIRVGDPKMKDIPPMQGMFDYAHSNIRSNRMDIFLFSQCRFFIGVSSGPILNPILFGVPTIMTNFMPVIGRPHASNCLYIPKLLWFNEHQRFATFPEILSSELGRIFTTHGYAEKNIKIIENSPDELKDVVEEMMDVLDKRLQYSKEDDDLQERLGVLYRQYSGYGDMGRIGKKFLEKYSREGLL